MNIEFGSSISIKSVCATTLLSGATLLGSSCVQAPAIIGGCVYVSGETQSNTLKLTSVAAKTSETAVAFLKTDGTIVSGTSTGGGVSNTLFNTYTGTTAPATYVKCNTDNTLNCALTIGTANVDSDSKLTISGTMTIAAGVTQALKSQIEQDGSSLYINSNQNWLGAWTLYDDNKAPAQIRLNSDSENSSIVFATKAANTAGATDRVIINQHGNVGIGTTTPDRKLSINSPLCVADGIRITYNDALTEGAELMYLNDAASTVYLDSKYNHDGAAMKFRMKTAGTPVEAITILGSGAMTFGGNVTFTCGVDAVSCLCAGTTVTAGTCLVAVTSAISPIFASASGNVALRAGAEGVVCGVANGTVALYYDNVAKICTLATGACIVGNGCATDFIASSDCRLKKNIKPILDALSLVTKLQGVYYNLCCDNDDIMNVGLIAQDVQKILPEIVAHGEPNEDDEKYGITDDKLGLKYDKLTAVLIEAIKEQQKEIETMKIEINKLKEI